MREKKNKGLLCGLGINNAKGKGIVLSINSHEDFHKVKGGEVVITTNATPDFILILRKIKCLITDQGSMTCHIAIVCRELGIPAILATGHATEYLKEGDLVSFDTVSGEIYLI